jgi:hypothetical protein
MCSETWNNVTLTMFRGTKQPVQFSKSSVLDEQVGQNSVLSVMFL